MSTSRSGAVVARWAHTPKVTSSSLVSATTKRNGFIIKFGPMKWNGFITKFEHINDGFIAQFG